MFSIENTEQRNTPAQPKKKKFYEIKVGSLFLSSPSRLLFFSTLAASRGAIHIKEIYCMWN